MPFKKGLIPWNKGLPMSAKTKSKVSKAKVGRPAWNKGLPSPWASKRNTETNPLRRGSKHWNWKGGISKERHLWMGRSDYKQWRSNVFQRDNWTCQTCQFRGGYLEAHHVKEWANYPELRFDVNNGVTLCLPCHKLTDNYGPKAKKSK